MAKATLRTNPVVHLELSLEEALWVKGLTQNFLSCTSPSVIGNTYRTRRIRRTIFEALPPFNKLAEKLAETTS
jgi:hypothetical protein